MRWTPWWEGAFLYAIYNINLQIRERFRGKAKKVKKSGIYVDVRGTLGSTSLDQADRLWTQKDRKNRLLRTTPPRGASHAGNTYV
jgi:hypothetical protein